MGINGYIIDLPTDISSGTSFYAPANGYITAKVTANQSNNYIFIRSVARYSNLLPELGNRFYSSVSNNLLNSYLPVKKNQEYNIYFSGTLSEHRFFYSNYQKSIIKY